MKNIYLLPTQSKTRLFLSDYGKKLNLASFPETFYTTGQHIYIAYDDEEIKEGDWFTDDNNSLKKSYKLFHVQFANPKKIVLTTDQDLIKDGVQAISNDFLEWFIKNPSCDSVKVSTEVKCFDNRGWCVGGIHFNTDYEKTIYYINLKEEPKEDKIMKRFISNAKQQKTIKEVAKNILIKKGLSDGDMILSDTFVKVIESMIEIAKETENRKQGYSEDDLKEAFKQSRESLIFEKGMPPVYESFEDWFKEFKKKSL